MPPKRKKVSTFFEIAERTKRHYNRQPKHLQQDICKETSLSKEACCSHQHVIEKSGVSGQIFYDVSKSSEKNVRIVNDSEHSQKKSTDKALSKGTSLQGHGENALNFIKMSGHGRVKKSKEGVIQTSDANKKKISDTEKNL